MPTGRSTLPTDWHSFRFLEKKERERKRCVTLIDRYNIEYRDSLCATANRVMKSINIELGPGVRRAPLAPVVRTVTVTGRVTVMQDF